MSLSVILACLWALACTFTAFLPMRYQVYPGLPLLFAFPPLLWFLAYQHGAWVPLLFLAAGISLFRKPLAHLFRKITGRPT